MKKYYEEMNIARGIGIFLVVLGHSFPDAQMGIENNLYAYIFRFIYSFHMPLFFFISGFVSIKLLSLKSFKDKINGIKSKFIRLMVPYFAISVPSLVLKYLFADLSYVKFDFNNSILNIFLGENPNGGLWFLYTLFTIALITILLNKVDIKYLLAIFLILAVLPIQYTGLFKINRLCANGLYYLLGIYINKKYELFKSKFIEKKYILIMLTLLIFINIFNISTRSIIVLMAISGIYLTLVLSIAISKYKNTVRNSLNLLGEYSYDIYLISYFIQIPIRVIFYTKLDFNYEIIILAMFILGIIIPIAISKYIVRNSKILSALILGDYCKKIEAKEVNLKFK